MIDKSRQIWYNAEKPDNPDSLKRSGAYKRQKMP